MTQTVDATEHLDGCNHRERKKQATRQRIHEVCLDLVRERGLNGATIEEICALAGVSQRTFFNYFPTKAAGALGLDPAVVDPALLEKFRNGTGTVIDDLTYLVVYTLPRSRKLKELVHERPELGPSVREWMGQLRDSILSVVTERSDEETAMMLVTLVIVTLMQVLHEDQPPVGDELAVHMQKVLRKMRPLIPAD